MTAVIASNLTARVRAQAIVARQRARTTEDLYRFSRKLAGVGDLDDLLWATVYQVAQMLKVRVVLLLPEGGTSRRCAPAIRRKTRWTRPIWRPRKWCWEHDQPAGRGADTLPGAKRLFLPMRTGRGAVGVIGIDSDEPGPLLTPDQRRLLDALSDQAALAIERVNLAEDVDRARLAAETERLRSALLTSISHDLRTPLASILGSATSLSRSRADDEATRTELLRTIQEEAERLNRFIANLLDMTRLESARCAANPEPVECRRRDRQRAAARRQDAGGASRRRWTGARPADARLDRGAVRAGAVQPAGQCRQICAGRHAGDDHAHGATDGRVDGAGDGRRARHSAGGPASACSTNSIGCGGTDRQRAGTGLGLAICRGFIEAMGGTITAANRTDRSGRVHHAAAGVRQCRTGGGELEHEPLVRPRCAC